jgi:hypothetical protein
VATREERKAELVIEAIQADRRGINRGSHPRDYPRQQLFNIFLGELSITDGDPTADYRSAWDAVYRLIRAYKVLGVE